MTGATPTEKMQSPASFPSPSFVDLVFPAFPSSLR